MLKLYKSNYTRDELLSMAEHCYSFCHVSSNIRLPNCSFYCEYYRICRDFCSRRLLYAEN